MIKTKVSSAAEQLERKVKQPTENQLVDTPVLIFETIVQNVFYEGGKAAVDLSYANGTDILLNESTLNEFANKFEQLVKSEQQVTQSAPEEIVAPVHEILM